MKREFNFIDKEKKKEVIDKIREILLGKDFILFAYIYGSFTENSFFRDIDIGIYLKEFSEEDLDKIELSIIKEISEKTNIPFETIDLRVLNIAKSSFLNNIFREGLLLFTKDKEFLADLIEKTSLEAISNEYFSILSLKELLS